MSTIEVHDAGDLRKYRTEIPNIIFDLGLSPHALALYMHLKRTCGQSGKCWKSRERLAEEAQMSTGKVTEARQELRQRKLISVHRPENRRKSVEVTITDIWPKNFEHFSRRQHMTATPSEYDTRKEPLEEDVEANASSGIAENADSANVIGLEKHVVDQLYAALDGAGYTLDNSDFGYHLGRAKKMLEKMNPTDGELDDLPAAAVEHFEVYSKTDSMAALRYLRQQKARRKRIDEGRNEGRDREKVEKPSYVKDHKGMDPEIARMQAEMLEGIDD